MNIYEDMKAAGVQIDNHESDLYVPVTDVTRAIVARYSDTHSITSFRHATTGAHWYDIPFAYAPFWANKAKTTNLTPEQIEMRDKAMAAALACGYTRDSDGELRAPPGKFEGQPYYVLFYYEATATTGAKASFGTEERTEVDILDVTEDERAAFELNANAAYIALGYSESGFVHLTEGTKEDYAALAARYVDDEETDEEDEE